MMRWIVGQLVIAFTFVALATPASASPTVIARLGAAPLLGSSRSTRELRTEVDRHPERFALAARELGLSDPEYQSFLTALNGAPLPFGPLPRHVQAMAFYRSGAVRVLGDVIMPAHTYGWEVDIVETGRTLRVLIPATCGNLSILRASHPAVAARHVRVPPTQVAASAEHAASAAPAPAVVQPSSTAAPSAPASPSSAASPSAAQSPLPATSPIPSSAPPTPPTPSAHHFRWPWLLPVALIFFFHGHGGGGSPPPAGGCGCGCP